MNAPIKITCKKQFQGLWHQGIFGNKARDWRNIDELKRSRFRGTVAIRYCGRCSGSLFIKDLSVQAAESKMRELCATGWTENDLYLLEQITPQDTRYMINGELVLLDGVGLALFYSHDNMLMRDALTKSGTQLYGRSANAKLRESLWPTDFDELMDLLDRFQGHAIEFSGFREPVGLLSHHRMIVWEVRAY